MEVAAFQSEMARQQPTTGGTRNVIINSLTAGVSDGLGFTHSYDFQGPQYNQLRVAYGVLSFAVQSAVTLGVGAYLQSLSAARTIQAVFEVPHNAVPQSKVAVGLMFSEDWMKHHVEREYLVLARRVGSNLPAYAATRA